MKATGGTVFKRHTSAFDPPRWYIISPPFTHTVAAYRNTDSCAANAYALAYCNTLAYAYSYAISHACAANTYVYANPYTYANTYVYPYTYAHAYLNSNWGLGTANYQ